MRGNTGYGLNDVEDNGDGSITDYATELMWSQDDSGSSLNWEDALAWVEDKNAENYLGHSDWRLPNAKELQSIVDYTRSPDTTGSAAIDPLFNATSITNEAGEDDYPCYWSSSTHANWTDSSGTYSAYVAFGRAMGYIDGSWIDVHGAGAQRSDPKAGDPADYPPVTAPRGMLFALTIMFAWCATRRPGRHIAATQVTMITTECGNRCALTIRIARLTHSLMPNRYRCQL